MKKKYDLIVFDWDGTLMDSEAKIVRCFSAAAGDVGVPDPGRDAVRSVIGLGLREAVDTLFPHLETARQERITERYREHFLYLDRTRTDFFPGVLEGLERLLQHDFLLAVATGKARRGLDRLLDETGTGHLFTATRCADEAGSKPHPRMLYDILERTGVTLRRAVMVGDSVYDMQMARHAEIEALAVSYGVQDKDRLLAEKPLACLDSFVNVCAWLHKPLSTAGSMKAAPAKAGIL